MPLSFSFALSSTVSGFSAGAASVVAPSAAGSVAAASDAVSAGFFLPSKPLIASILLSPPISSCTAAPFSPPTFSNYLDLARPVTMAWVSSPNFGSAKVPDIFNGILMPASSSKFSPPWPFIDLTMVGAAV